jgi:hypothetical protein
LKIGKNNSFSINIKKMKKGIFILLLSCSVFFTAHSQLAILKMFGKNAKEHIPVGFGTFANYTFPLNEVGNNNLMIELLDLSFFPGIVQEAYPYDQVMRAYLSIKAGYRKIFSEESKTGFFIEPQIGYCRVVVANDNEPDAKYGDGIAAALEGGYNLEVGKRGSSLSFSLKFESDLAGKDYTIHSLGLRFAYNFLMFRSRRN